MQSLYPLTAAIFKEKVKQPVSKLEITIGDGADSIDLCNFYGKNYMKEFNFSSGQRELTYEPVAAEFTAIIDDTDGLFNPKNTDSPFYSFLKKGEQVTFSMGFRIDGIDYLWQWFVGVVSKVQIDRANKQIILSGFDYTQYLIDVKLKSPNNYWGSSVTKSVVADQMLYDLPVECNGVYIAYLDGSPIYDQDTWLYDKASNKFCFLPSKVPGVGGTNNLIIYYYTDQIPENVIADLLVTAGRYPTQAAALADMDYTATGVTIERVRFNAGVSVLYAIQKICERVDYHFYFKHDATPVFKPIPEKDIWANRLFDFDENLVGEFQYLENIDEVRNHIVIEGEEYTILDEIVRILNGTEVMDGAITTDKLADLAITNPKIAVAAIYGDIIKVSAITEEKILAGAVTELKLAALAVTNAKIAVNAIYGDCIKSEAITASKIAALAVTTSKIDAEAVTAVKIATDAVTSDKIIANAVTAVKINAGAVTTAKIDAFAVTASEIAAGAVTAIKIAALAVSAEKIAANTITAAQIAAGTITATEMATNTITADKLTVGIFGSGNQLDNGNFEDWSGGTDVAPDGWILSGAGAAVERHVVSKLGNYSAWLSRNGTDCELRQSIYDEKGISYWQGRTIIFSCWVYATVAERASIYIYDGIGTTYSSYHTGDSTWQLLTATRTINAGASELRVMLSVANGDTAALFDGAMCVEGSYVVPYADKIRNWGHPSDYTLIDGGDIYTGTVTAAKIAALTITATQIAANTLTIAKLATETTDRMFDSSADSDNVQAWKSGADATKIDGGKIYTNTVVVAGLASAVTDRMFLDSTTKTNIEAWRHASDVTLIDGGDIYTGTINANKLKLTQTGNDELLGLYQGASTDQIFKIRSTSVDHQVTLGEGLWGTDTDCFAYFRKLYPVFGAYDGGLHINTFTEDTAPISFQLYAVYGAASTAKDGTATGAINLAGLKADPVNHTYKECAINENIFCLKTKPPGSAYQAVFIVDCDGDVLYDGAASAFQDEDDIQLLRELEDILSDRISKKDMKQKDIFKKHKVIHVSEWRDEETKRDILSRFISSKKLNMLLMGSIRQLNDKILTLEEKTKKLEA